MITSTETATSVEATVQRTVIQAGDYLNKLSGEQIEYECKRSLEAGCRELVVNFSETELVNSIGISILLGVIDTASNNGATVVFSDVNENTVELFEMLGITKHVILAKAAHNSQNYGGT